MRLAITVADARPEFYARKEVNHSLVISKQYKSKAKAYTVACWLQSGDTL
jgi:hypothetical protein